MSISKLHARQIYDSRGTPTLEIEVFTERGVFRAAVPSGASTGVHEALELRDKNPAEHNGKGVSKALNSVNGEIAPALIKSGLKVTDQSAIDDFLIKLDGTPNKSNLGANAILGVSMAVARAGAAHNGIPLYKHIANLAGVKEPGLLPVPFFNVINGGVHAGNSLAFQEVMIVPVGASKFSEAMKIGSEVYHKLEGIIKKKYGVNATNVGAEGGFAPPISDVKDALELIKQAISEAGYVGKVKCALDCAASEFFEDGLYNLSFKTKDSKNEKLTASKLTELYNELIKTYPLISIEDPFSEEQFDDHAELTAKCGIQIVGDDLLVTNPSRIATAIEKKSVNALLLKVNQIGTVKESIEAFKMSKAANWNVMVSHRSGETEDTFIADLVVGLSSGQIKSGAPCRSERLAKYNQLLRIEEELGPRAKYIVETLPGNNR